MVNSKMSELMMNAHAAGRVDERADQRIRDGLIAQGRALEHKPEHGPEDAK